MPSFSNMRVASGISSANSRTVLAVLTLITVLLATSFVDEVATYHPTGAWNEGR
jgi:hypothetical protein